MSSVDNQELLRTSGWSFPVDLQVSHESPWRTGTQKIEKFFDLSTGSFYLRLNPTIRKISTSAATTFWDSVCFTAEIITSAPAKRKLTNGGGGVEVFMRHF